MNSLQLLFTDHRKQFLTTLAVFIVVGIIGIAVSVNSQQQFFAKSPITATSDHTAPSDNQATLGDNTSTTENPTTTQTPTTPAAHSSTPATPVATTPPTSTPFSIASVSLSGASWNCSNGGVVMYVASAQVIAMSQVGGTFTWQLEITGNPSAPGPIPSSSTIPKSQGSYSITAGNPGYIYSAFDVRDGQSVRVHITSPNDIASQRFTIPAGSEASCANS